MRNYFSFTGVAQIEMEHETGTPQSKHVATNVRLEISDNLDKSIYLTDNNLPTKEGVKPLTVALVQGLVANIHSAHQLGYWDSAEHIRYIIDELQRGFVQVAHVSEGEMDK